MHKVMQQLHDDHRNVERLLDFIRDQASKERTEADFEAMHQVMHYLTHYPDVFHHPREDLVFARLLERDPSCYMAVEKLKQEHERLAVDGAQLRQRLYDKLRGRRLQWPTLSRQLHDYAGLLQQHMELEERSVFPLAKLLLADRDWDSLSRQIRQREDPLFGTVAAMPYSSLLMELERRH